jgi:HSP20 family protein
LTVQGEKKVEYDEEKENYRMMERSFGNSNVHCAFPTRCTRTKSRHGLKNGVLKVTLPKHADAAGAQRRIDIKKA